MIDTNLIESCTVLFQAKAGDLNYVPWIDINKDGIIDMRDYAWMVQHVGETIDVPADQMPVYQNVNKTYWKGDPYWIDESKETVPTEAEMQSAFDAALQTGIGALTQQAVDSGLALTVTSYTVLVKNTFIQRVFRLAGPSGAGFWFAQYQAEVECTISYDCTLPVISNSLTLLIVACIFAFIFAVGAIVVAYKYFDNMSRPLKQEDTSTFKFTNTSPYPVTVTLPDGSTMEIPAGGEIDYTQTESKEETQWTGLLMPIIVGIFALIALVLVMGRSRK